MGGSVSKQLTPFSINAPGFSGINTQDASIDLPSSFALEAMNAIIDQNGRIGARKGWLKAATTSITNNVEMIHELIDNSGNSYIICAGNNKIYKLTGSTLTELTYGGGGATPTITTSNWQAATLNGIMYLFQRGYDPLIFDPATSTTTYRRLSEHASYTNTTPYPLTANTVLSAYGRLWIADFSTDKSTLYWCDTASGVDWTGGTSGYLNLHNVWPNGADEIVALAAHNGFLVIFGKRQVVLYSGAHNPTSLTLATLQDTIVSIGCIARDSVQSTGDDLIFLSNRGVYSLNRIIQEKSNPLRDLSKNVRDHLGSDITNELSADITKVKAIYSDVNSFYLLSMPATGEVYCFDMRRPLEDGSARVTRWNSIAPKSFFQARNRTLYIGMNAYLGYYTGYLDNTSSYNVKYYSPHLNFGGLSSSSILKKISAIIIGGSGQLLTFKYAADYSTNYVSEQASTPTRTIAEYGIAEYGIAEFTDGISIDTVNLQAGGAGKVLQFGIETTINGYGISIQKLDIFTKQGKML